MALVVDRVDFFDSGCSFFFGLTQNKKTGVGVHKNHKIPGWNKRAKTRRTSQCHLSTTKPSKKPPQKKQMKQYALREKLRHYSSSALCGPGGGSTAPLGATSILEDIGNIGILDGGTEVFFFLVFLLFVFFYSFSSFFFCTPRFCRECLIRGRDCVRLDPLRRFEYLSRVSFSSIFFEYLLLWADGAAGGVFFSSFHEPEPASPWRPNPLGTLYRYLGHVPLEEIDTYESILKEEGKGGGVWHGNSGADDFTIGFATENGGVCFYFGSFFFFKSFFMLRGRRFSFVFIVSFASSSSFRPFSFSYRRGSRFESLGGCFLFFF